MENNILQSATQILAWLTLKINWEDHIDIIIFLLEKK